MFNRPKFRASICLKLTEQGEAFLLSERYFTLLDDPLLQLISPLIDGDRTVDEIITILEGKVATTQIYYVLMWMKQQGYIEERDNVPLPASAVFSDALCEAYKLDVKNAQNNLNQTKVAVRSIGSTSASELISILESLQIEVAEDGDIEVILTDDYLCTDIGVINQQALHHSRPWMLVKPVGTIVWIGPIFYPGETGCWECMVQRIRGNRPVAGFLERHKVDSLALPTAFLPSTQQTALNIAATEIFKWIFQGRNQQLEGKLMSYDTFSLSTEIHLIPKRPQCSCCGDPTLMQKPLPLLLGSRKKKFTADGGHRYCLPEETLRKYQHHISSITGIIRELQKVSLADANDLIHTYVAKHHFTTMFDDLDDLRLNIGGRSVGKGKTDLQAKASALGEAIERYSSVFQGDEPRERGNYGKFGDRAIHPNTCMNYSQEQYNTREEWNTSHPNSKFQKVPEPFDEEQERDWTPVWSLTDGEFKYLPTAYCYPGYPKPPQPDCWANSNGSAAGNTIEEAILQGFMELVERDCVGLWWYNRIKRPEVNLDSFDETYFSALKNYYQKLNRDIWVIDITNDFNIPTFAAISQRVDRKEKEEDIIYGFAAHFDSKLAISRALTEVNQNLSNVQSANADGSTRYPIYSDFFALKWWKTATLENQPYLAPDESIAPKVWDDYPQEWSDDLLEDITICQQLVEKKGMEMLVLDQTRPDIGLKVVKVIVPGMRHFWRRFGAGRLYEIPVQLGWLKEPLAEKQLNPFPIWW